MEILQSKNKPKEASSTKQIQGTQSLIRKPIVKPSNNIIQNVSEKKSKKPEKKFISIEDDPNDRNDTKLKFLAGDFMKKTFFKKKGKKGFLSHRKKHRNQKRREV